MSKTRIAGLALGATLLGAGAPASAQVGRTDYEAIVRIMRECAQIAEIAARVACYDNTIGAEQLIADARRPGDAAPPPTPAPPTPAPSTAPPAPPRDVALAAPPPAPAARGFGAETLPASQAVRQAQPDEVELAVSQAQSVEPGIYLLTLEDGSQWRFLDAVPMSYDPPRSGERVELVRASLGSFLMSYASQRSVRIRRVR